MSSGYDDIINLPHHVSATRKPMPLANRAAQFAPFAALTGHGAAISETARLTSGKIELSPDELLELSRRLNFALANLSDRPEVAFTVFKIDSRKAGGCYVRMTGVIRKMDLHARLITLTDGRMIVMDDIVTIEGDIFKTFG